jgi:CubicO group peptidase (beta-lactamase class C family)
LATASAGDARAAEGWPIGCVAKLLTATLVRRAAARGALDLDGGAAPLLGAAGEALRGVTLRQLLEHSHGLDDSLLAPPRYEHGRIDRPELVRRVGALERFARPGAAYSYGHVGAWLAAAILERTHARAFAALVREELLRPLGCDAARRDSDTTPLCAASGSGLVLTAEQLARFGLLALTSDDSLAGAPITPLPGWHPLERGVCLGWKYFGAGWFGHQSVWPRASIFLRVQPQRRLAFVVIASEEAAALVALAVFGSRLAEVFEWRTMPSRGEASDAAVAEDAPGTYEQAARVVAIVRVPHGLQVETWERDEHGAPRGAPRRASLAPIRGVLFGKPASEHLPYAELVASESGGRWLWNGRCVLRRA